MGYPKFIEVVLADDGTVNLSAYRQDACVLDRDYDSLLDLLNELFFAPFEDSEFVITIADNWREEAMEALDSIISTTVRPVRTLPENFMLYQQVHKMRDCFEYQVHVRKVDILADIQAYVRSLGDPFKVDTYSDISATFEKYDFPVTVKEYYGFGTNRDFNNWVLQSLINQNPLIYKCAHCSRYFVPKRPSSQKCCSTACKEAYRVKTNYCGEDELAKLANAIKSFFDRKEKSDKRYMHLFPKLDHTYDTAFLFDQAKVSKTNPLTKREFAKLRQVYSVENDKQLREFTSVYNLFKAGELSESKYIEKRDQYLLWMQNVHRQLKACSSKKELLEEFEDV